MRISLPLLCLSLTLPAAAHAQGANGFPRAARPEDEGFSSARLSRIDSLIEPMVAKGEIPGAVVFLARNGRVVLHKAYGYRDVGTRAPLKGDDLFRIASQTKAITSLAVMMLWEEGRFGLDDPIERYLPEFAKPTVLTKLNAADTTWESAPAQRSITIRHLLTHSSGIDYGGIGSEDFKAIYAKAGVPSGLGNIPGTIGEKMRVLGKLPLRHQPGERFTYSLSIDVLGHFVEVVSGMPLDRFFRTRILDPLGMRDTWFFLPPDRAERLVTLHDGEGGRVRPRREPVFDGVDPDYPKRRGTYFSGGAGLSSSVEDYARFLQMFLNGGELDGVRLLGPKTVEMMLTDQLPSLPAEHGLAFGLETPSNDHQSPRSVGSFNWGGAFNTMYWADPQEQLIGILYTNMYNTEFGALGTRFTALTYAALVH
jgi:CubicO group peptidase (beta-lactamase class C family)